MGSRYRCRVSPSGVPGCVGGGGTGAFDGPTGPSGPGGSTGPTGPAGPTGGGTGGTGEGCPGFVSQTLFVDHSTAVATPLQTGELCTPFATIQQALDVTDELVVWAIFCAPGVYDEDLIVPARSRIRVSPWGGTTERLGSSWLQGVNAMLSLGPEDLSAPRTITWASPGPAVGPRHFFGFQGLISGGIIVSDGGDAAASNTLFVWEFVGTGGVDASGHADGFLDVRFEGSNVSGPVVVPDTGLISQARNAFFADTVEAHILDEVHDCFFSAGFDCSPAGVTAAAKLFNTQVQGTITNCDNLTVDGSSEYWHRFLSGAVPFAGSTTEYIRADDPLEQDVSITDADSPYTISPAIGNSVLLRVIYVDSSGGVVTVELPAAPVRGDEFKVKDSAGAAATNAITVDGNGNTIDGAATRDMNANYESLWFKWNGTEWSIL